jgi:L-amino acid N-acyltransferase YncA
MMFNLVMESNPSRKLYEQVGFVTVGRVPQAIGAEDAHIYWRAL